MTRRKDSDGNPINRDRRSRTILSVDHDMDIHDQADAFSNAVSSLRSLDVVLQWFTEQDDGALKIRRSTDAPDLHLTWTWSIGPYARNYVYVRVEYWRLLFGLELLSQKIKEVQDQSRKPTHDKYNR